MTSTNLPRPLEPLLRHEPWLRGLMRGLVAPADVDDVVQEAWLAALRGPVPRSRAWLAAVARNLARLKHRRDARRGSRERAVARPEATAGADQVVHELHALRRVARAVERLPEPYRTTVVLRYHDGLDARRIAARTGTTPEAARQRLKRGLDRLRADLQRGTGLGALAVVACLARGTAAAVAAGPVTIGVLTMAKTKLIAATLVALLCTVSLWQAFSPPSSALDTPPADGVAAARRAATDGVGGGDDGPATGAGRTALPVGETVAPAPGATFTLRGCVVDADGRPMAGVPVGYFIGQNGRHSSRPHQLDPARRRDQGFAVVGESDGDGRFDVECPQVLMGLLAGAPFATIRTTRVAPGREQWDDLVLIAARAIDIAGTIRCSDGGDLVDARVMFDIGPLPSYPGVLDRTRPIRYEGSRSHPRNGFVLRGVPAGHGRLRFGAESVTGVEMPTPATSRGGLDIVLSRAAQTRYVVAGVVVDHHGRPAEGVTVDIGGDRGRTDRDGRFELDFTSSGIEGLADRVLAGRPGFEPACLDGLRELLAARPDRKAHVRLELGPPTSSIEGRVFAADGTPMSGVFIVPWDLQAADPHGFAGSRTCSIADWGTQREGEMFGDEVWTTLVATTSADGSFQLANLPARDYVLRVYEEQRLVAFTTGPIAAGSTGVGIVAPAELVRAPILGRVVDRAGRPVPRVLVVAELPRMRLGERTTWVYATDAISDEAGRFELRGVATAVEVLTVTGDILPLRIELGDDDARARHIVVERRCHVRFALDGERAEAAEARLLDGDGDVVPTWTFHSDGDTSAAGIALDHGRAETTAVSGAAIEVVLLDRAGAEVGRIPVRLEPGVVTVVR